MSDYFMKDLFDTGGVFNGIAIDGRKDGLRQPKIKPSPFRKSLDSYWAKMQVQKDAAGHQYCVQEGVGRVPCNNQEETTGQSQGQAAETANVQQEGQEQKATSPDEARASISALGKMTMEQLHKAGVAIAQIEHVAEEYANDKIAEHVAKLPEHIQPLVKGTFLACRIGRKGLFATYIAGQKTAELVAKKRGATPEQAKALRQTLAWFDVIAVKPVVIATTVIPGLQAFAIPAGFLPVASLSYLAYTGMDTAARKAWRLVGAATGRGNKDYDFWLIKAAEAQPVEGGRTDTISDTTFAEQVYAAMDEADWSPWWRAIFAAAVDQTQDPRRAIEIANQLYKKHEREEGVPEAPEVGENPLGNKSLSGRIRIKAAGEPCKPGERADLTGCIPNKPAHGRVGRSGLRDRDRSQPLLPGMPPIGEAGPAQQTPFRGEAAQDDLHEAKTERTAHDYGFSEADFSKFQELKKDWAITNNSMQKYMRGERDSPELRPLILRQKDIVKQLHELHASHGSWGEIGRPGAQRDVVIIGAGPGGMQAASAAGTEGLNALLIEAEKVPGGQAKYSSRIQNFAAFPAGVSGEELATRMFEQVQVNGAETKMGVKVTGVSLGKNGMKIVKLSNGEEIETRSVIIAGGVQFKKLTFPGSDSDHVITGAGKILAEKANGKPVVIIGGSNAASQAALEVADRGSKVYILARSGIETSMSEYQVISLRNHPRIEVIERDQLEAFVDNQKVTTKNGRTIPAEYVGVFVGQAPETNWLPREIRRDKEGKVVVNHDLQTKMPGVFAIGDVRKGGMGRIMGAAGEGSLAVKNLFPYFKGMIEAEKKGSASNV